MSDWIDQKFEYAELRGEKVLFSEKHDMCIFTSASKSTLARENEIYLTFEGEGHLDTAKSKADEILTGEAGSQ